MGAAAAMAEAEMGTAEGVATAAMRAARTRGTCGGPGTGRGAHRIGDEVKAAWTVER